MRTWFIVNLAKKRLLPPAAALRQFMIDESHTFLPSFKTGADAPARVKRAHSRKAKAGKRMRAAAAEH
jgi:hypothetical protein